MFDYTTPIALNRDKPSFQAEVTVTTGKKDKPALLMRGDRVNREGHSHSGFDPKTNTFISKPLEDLAKVVIKNPMNGT